MDGTLAVPTRQALMHKTQIWIRSLSFATTSAIEDEHFFRGVYVLRTSYIMPFFYMLYVGC